MSVIATYVRLGEGALDLLRRRSDWMQALYAGQVMGAEVIDIDKACDGIVWLLSRIPAPSASASGNGFTLNRSLAPLMSGAGGRKERSLEAPYGPASALTVEQVRELSAWLSGIDGPRLRALYDAQAMAAARVYPEIWMTEGSAAFEDYLLPGFTALKTFVAEAATAGQQLLVFFA